jgi:hypothetical protein
MSAKCPDSAHNGPLAGPAHRHRSPHAAELTATLAPTASARRNPNMNTSNAVAPQPAMTPAIGADDSMGTSAPAPGTGHHLDAAQHRGGDSGRFGHGLQRLMPAIRAALLVSKADLRAGYGIRRLSWVSAGHPYTDTPGPQSSMRAETARPECPSRGTARRRGLGCHETEPPARAVRPTRRWGRI